MKNIKDIQLNIEVWQEGDMYISYAPQLNVSSCGQTVDEAKKNIREAVEGFLEELERMGTSKEVLEEAGFSFDKSWKAPELVSFERMKLAF